MSRAEERGGKAAAGLEGGAAIGGAVAGIGAAAAAANAIPIAGQVASAALGLAAMFTKIFVGRKQKKRRQQHQKVMGQIAQQRQYRQGQLGVGQQAGGQAFGMMGMQAPQPQPAPPTQGYGMFQQMQEGPIYSSGGTSGQV
jgi:hypothetical protein